MTALEERAASLSRDEIVVLLQLKEELQARLEKLEHELRWYRQQLFGPKSERRHTEEEPDSTQIFLGEPFARRDLPAATVETVRSYTRRHKQDVFDDTSDETPPRFDPSVPVEEIRLPNPEIEGLPPESYDVIDEKVTLRLAQRQGPYVVLRYVRPVVKLKETGTFSCPPAPPAVLEKSFADVSLLAGILIDKFLFHCVPRSAKGDDSSNVCAA